MRSNVLCLGLAASLMLAFAFVDGDAQTPGKKGFGKKGDARSITADQIVERIMSFDKNKTGKITADDLPERMQHLVALGDINKDGALDKDEIRKLATTLEAFAGLTSGDGGGQKGGAPKGAKGVAGEVQRALDELNVSRSTRDKADRALRSHQDKVRKFDELASTELILQMKEVLSEEDYRTLKIALDRSAGKGSRSQDLNARIDQLQKELEELRVKVTK